MKDLLKQACSDLGIKLNEEQIEKFMSYKKLLLEWNEKVNLTSITDEREIILKHFVDCLSITTVYDIKADTKVIDVGTGAGFPGIPLKIVYPDIKLTLLDSLNKRILFLQDLNIKLEFKNVDCIHSRAEDSGQNKLYREKYDLCASRAVADLSVLAEYCLPFVSIGGSFISFKGAEIEDELNQSKTAIKKLGGEIQNVEIIKIPFSDITHSIITIKKLRQTPSQYPRKAGTISKQPIK